MNAANAPISSKLENERRAHEPSMEEILASIRKIIADDEALPLSRQPGAARLFESNVTPFAPPPPVMREEPLASVEAPPREETASVETPAPSPIAAASEPVAEEAADVRSDLSHAQVDAPEVRLDAAEMESFAEVGRELARLHAPTECDDDAERDDNAERGADAEQGEALRPTLDASPEIESAADASDDVEVNPVPHETAHEAAYDEPFAAPEPVAASERMILPEPPRFFEAAREHREFAAAGAPAVERAPAGMGAMLSAEANASVASAFQALSASVQIASAEAVDRHVRDMLRPMLKQWLDDNLPVMVERLVRAEIERVARGGR